MTGQDTVQTGTAGAWSRLLARDQATRNRLMRAAAHATTLAPVDHRWDAVVITSLRRGLAALDLMGLPMDHGYPVVADYLRQDLIVQVPSGSARDCTASGTRALSAGSWLLLPADPSREGSICSTWLSRPAGNRYVDVPALCEALKRLDGAPDDVAAPPARPYATGARPARDPRPPAAQDRTGALPAGDGTG